MIHAYDKTYLDPARISLGRMLDFAVYDLEYDLEVFFDIFINSFIASLFEKGDCTILAGKSGIELVYEILPEKSHILPRFTRNRSEEYWTGWAVAYYQWLTSLHFSEIVRYIPIKDIQALYSPFHEMDIRHFVDKMNDLYREAKPDTNLKLLRQQAGFSQRELAELTGIPVRTIQQYEQRQKSINRAQAYYLLILSRTLCCNVDDLIEHVE